MRHGCERSGIHSREASGGSGGCAASTRGTAASGAGFIPAKRAGGLGGAPLAPQRHGCERSGIHSREASGGSGGCAASTPEARLRAERDSFPRSERGGGGVRRHHPPACRRPGGTRSPCEAVGRVELQSTGKLTGNIRAPKIVIAEGAMFRGNSDMSGKKDERKERVVAY